MRFVHSQAHFTGTRQAHFKHLLRTESTNAAYVPAPPRSLDPSANGKCFNTWPQSKGAIPAAQASEIILCALKVSNKHLRRAETAI